VPQDGDLFQHATHVHQAQPRLGEDLEGIPLAVPLFGRESEERKEEGRKGEGRSPALFKLRW